MRNKGKFLLTLFLVFSMAVTMLTGCGESPASTAAPSGASGTSTEGAAPTEKEKVLLWYLWTGAEADVIEEVVEAYNAQSDRYVVESLSVPDMQKVMIAISSGSDGPDVTDDFSSNVASYATKGIIEPLDEYIQTSGFNLDDMVESALKSCTWDGATYALPISSSCSAMYYNKALLKEAGYSEPPKTMEELLEMSIAATTTNADGTIDVLGFPAFPNSGLTDFVVASGGGWLNGIEMNASHPGNLKGINYVLDYRKQFGVDNLSTLLASGKWLDPADPFLKGKQLFRFDGVWLATVIDKTVKATIDYGICEIPYPKDNPELAGRVLVTSSMFYVPVSAKNKEGGFDFAAFIAGAPGQKIMAPGFGAIPTVKSLLTEEFLSQVPGADFYGSYVVNKNAVAGLSSPASTEYDVIVGEETELALNLKKTPEEAIASIVERSKDLF